MKAKYGVRLVGISGTVEISSTDAMQQRLRSSKNLVKYYNAETGVLHQRSHEEEQSYRIQHFQTGIGNVWKPYADLGEDFEFDFAMTVGQKLRYVPSCVPGERIPLALRGITVAQLKEFHRNYPSEGSREKQYQMLAPFVINCEGSRMHGRLAKMVGEIDAGTMPFDDETEYDLVIFPTWENTTVGMKGKHIKPNQKQCPLDTSYMEWKFADRTGPQLPQAIISYSWATPWDLLVEFLEANIGEDGVIWIDILACDQHKVDCGNMEEIVHLPSVIEFLGQTYVMPSTLGRLWCIFEMAYSLLFNSRIIYYDTPAGQGEATGVMLEMLQKDEEQLARNAKDLLANANCFSPKDKAFIYGVIDRNFDSRDDMVNTIKAFIKSTSRQSQSSFASLADDGGQRSAHGLTTLDSSSSALFDGAAIGSIDGNGAPMSNPLGAGLAGLDGVRRQKGEMEMLEMGGASTVI
jgi:hypothetical protein